MDAPLTENRFSPILSRSSRIATGFRTRREAAGGDLRRVRGGRTGDRGAESSARTVAANTGPRSWLGVARQILLLVRLVVDARATAPTRSACSSAVFPRLVLEQEGDDLLTFVRLGIELSSRACATTGTLV